MVARNTFPVYDAIVYNISVLRDVNAKDKNTFKVRAYNKVLQSMKEYQKSVSRDINVNDIASIPNLSEVMRKKIAEIIDTGELHQVKEMGEDVLRETEAVNSLVNVSGIGQVKARQLYQKHGIKNVSDLKDKLKEDPGIINEVQKIGVKHYDDLVKRIPRKEMIKHDGFIGKVMSEAGLTYDIVGSYRREEKTSGDIDVLIRIQPGKQASEVLDHVISELSKKKYVLDKLAHGDKKFMGVCKLPRHRTARRLDVIVVTEEHYPFMVLYFTGSDKFNIAMRKLALEKGYSLNEYGLTATTTDAKNALANLSRPITDERHVFEFLGIPYVSPTDRKHFTSFQ